ncbi:MAG: hypothetical protein ISP90_14665 [Nevskia sp.]|nr:hypothetical protein [Nevskia sp.]
MCPLCLGTAALLVSGGSSAGGAAALLLRRRVCSRQVVSSGREAWQPVNRVQTGPAAQFDADQPVPPRKRS